MMRITYLLITLFSTAFLLSFSGMDACAKGQVVYGNSKTKVYHARGGAHMGKTRTVIFFNSPRAAQAKWYRVCTGCFSLTKDKRK